jgi:hypothetical protein
MRASFQSCSSSILVSLGTGALLVLIVVAVTGGFTIRAGLFRFSAHSAVAAAIVCAGAWLLAVALERSAAIDAAAGMFAAVNRRAAALALICAAASAGTSVAFGSYSAAGADAAGYLSQAAMLASGRVVRTEPLALSAGWPESELSFSPLGYRPGVAPGDIVPTYPPGLPLMFAAAHRLSGEFGPYLLISLLAAGAVLGAYAIGSALHSPLAGAIAAALTATSPIFIVQSLVAMSDVPATALWTLALASAVSGYRGSASVAGMLTGLAVLTRPNLIPIALVVAAVLVRRTRDRRTTDELTGGERARGERAFRDAWRPLAAFVLGGVPAAVVLVTIQWRIFGTPFASGHGSFSYLFSAANILPNVRDYTVRLVTGEWPALLLVAAAAAVLALRPPGAISGRNQDSPTTGAGGGPADARIATAAVRFRPANGVADVASLAALFAAAILICYLPYGVFPDWTYLRFLLPAFPTLFAATGALAVVALSRLPPLARGITLLALVTLVGALNVGTARRLQAFELRRNEGRYETVGRYLAAALPRNVVIISVQESASAWHYTGLPVLRWDLVPVALDAAIERLRALGATIRDVSLPHTDLAIPVYYIVAPAEASSNLARFDGVR